MWMFVPARTPNIVRRRFTPARWRLLAVKVPILLSREQVHAGGIGSGQLLEIAAASGIAVDATDANKLCFVVADASLSFVEAFRAAT